MILLQNRCDARHKMALFTSRLFCHYKRIRIAQARDLPSPDTVCIAFLNRP
jgi:hypothetical protein